jgi:hypothetical protein
MAAASRHDGARLGRDPIQLNRITIQILCFEHDLVRKPVSTFPDHALVPQMTALPAIPRHRRLIREAANTPPLRLN